MTGGSQVVITFLGPTNYKPACYYWPEAPAGCKGVTTDLFPLALRQWFPAAKFFVGLTKEAEGHDNWQKLRQEFGRCSRGEEGGGELEALPIPRGQSKEETWQIFEQMAKAAAGAEEVVIDFTHALRSIPLVAVVTTLYVSELGSDGGQPRVSHLLYGSYETPIEPPPAELDVPCGCRVVPVLDFIELARLADWLKAAHLFTAAGDAREVASLGKAWAADIRESAVAHPAGQVPAGTASAIEKLASTLHGFSLAIELGRPRDIRRRLKELTEAVETAAEAVEGVRGPLAQVLRALPRRYEKLAGDPEPASCLAPLELDLKAIEWYVEAERLVQACSLAREWMTTWACCATGKNWENREERSDAEQLLRRPPTKGNETSGRVGETPAPEAAPVLSPVLPPELTSQWRKLVERVKQWRDEINHCGVGRCGLTDAQTIEQNVRQLPEQLRKLLEALKNDVIECGR